MNPENEGKSGDSRQSPESSRECESAKETNREPMKDVNKLVYKGNVKSKLDAERAKQQAGSKRDEIPLIDDGVEETGEKCERSDSANEGSSPQTRLRREETPDNRENSQRIDHSPTGPTPAGDSSDRPASNSTVSSDMPSIPLDQPVAGLDQPQGQMMNNFQNINLDSDLNDEESIGVPHATDLGQLDSVEQLHPDEQEEKERLIQQLLELRNTLDDLSNRVSSVREMSFKLTNENNVLNQYVENLMSASSVFVATNAPSVKQRRQRK